MKKTLILAIFLLGFTAMSSQIVIMREFMGVFYGNELSIALILAAWLIWVALGSWALAGLKKAASAVTFFIFGEAALSLILPAIIVAVRLIKSALGFAVGEIVDFLPMALTAFTAVGPLCFLLGGMFAVGCVCFRKGGEAPAESIGSVYVYEAVGSMAGGLLLSFILIRHLGSFTIIAFLSSANMLMASACAYQAFRRGVGTKPLFVTLCAILLFTGTLWLFGGWDRIDRFTYTKQWEGYDVVAVDNSIYGNLAVLKRGGETSFFYNGLHLYTAGDILSAEEAVHFALLEHPLPRDVLLIGGGMGGLVAETLKHPVQHVDYVELDPDVIALSQRTLEDRFLAPLGDRRVQIIYTDGRSYVKHTQKQYDVVIITVGDPYTAQLNRYFTVEFLQELKRILKESGVAAFSVTASDNYISDTLRTFMGSVYYTMRMVFPELLVIPGDTAHFLASPQRGLFARDYQVLEGRIRERGIRTSFVSEGYLFARMSPGRLRAIREDLINEMGGVLNHDFKPISYYYDIIFWSSRFPGSVFKKILTGITSSGIWLCACILSVCILLLGIARKWDAAFYKKAVLISVLTTGFSEIAFQVVILLSFQIIYGYLFYKLGLILTSFMIGLSAGGFFITKRFSRLGDERLAYMWVQAGICVYPFILPVVFSLFSSSNSGALQWAGSNVIFPLLPIIAGFLGGIQFPLANKLYLGGSAEVGHSAGLYYGMDLAGSCVGALITAAILIPLLGIYQTCFFVALLNISVLLLLRVAFIPKRPFS
ncbi:MAG: hypothetical protein JW844_03710 [Candidatus Omnitrophica bacterium]|nr:hypothetical protein [Candidatus Omnitrophota bacterium]